jgi:hypothetical protein
MIRRISGRWGRARVGMRSVLGAHKLCKYGAELVGVVRGAGERVQRVAKAREPDDVQRRGGEARDGRRSGAWRSSPGRAGAARGRTASVASATREDEETICAPRATCRGRSRELANLGRPERGIEDAALGAVRRVLGDEGAPAEGAAEESAHEQAVLKRVRLREDVLDRTKLGCDHHALLRGAEP